MAFRFNKSLRAWRRSAARPRTARPTPDPRTSPPHALDELGPAVEVRQVAVPDLRGGAPVGHRGPHRSVRRREGHLDRPVRAPRSARRPRPGRPRLRSSTAEPSAIAASTKKTTHTNPAAAQGIASPDRSSRRRSWGVGGRAGAVHPPPAPTVTRACRSRRSRRAVGARTRELTDPAIQRPTSKVVRARLDQHVPRGGEAVERLVRPHPVGLAEADEDRQPSTGSMVKQSSATSSRTAPNRPACTPVGTMRASASAQQSVPLPSSMLVRGSPHISPAGRRDRPPSPPGPRRGRRAPGGEQRA